MSVQRIKDLPAGEIVFVLIILFPAFIHSCTDEVASLSVIRVLLIESVVPNRVQG